MDIDPGQRDDEQKKTTTTTLSASDLKSGSSRLTGRRCPEDGTAAAARFSYTAEVPVPSGIDLKAHQFSHFLHPESFLQPLQLLAAG